MIRIESSLNLIKSAGNNSTVLHFFYIDIQLLCNNKKIMLA